MNSEQQAVPYSAKHEAWKRFCSDRLALTALIMLMLLVFIALAAPLLANPRPLLEYTPGNGLSMPFWRSFFQPETTEVFIEQLFNYLLMALPVYLLARLIRHKLIRRITTAVLLALLVLPFILTSPKLERVNYRNATAISGGFRIMAPLPYGPFEQNLDQSCAKPSREHPMGVDELGRDLMTRIIYGCRIALAVGLLSTILAAMIGITVGVSSGYIAGWFDICVMRLVEILMCFPVFLLLLIVMTYFQDYQFEQSILAVTLIIGLTSWIGMAMLARGEVLKLREMAYIKAARGLGVSSFKIVFRHILPNIAGTLVIAFSFNVAGAILAESSLSFLGFGVHPPTASLGDMLRTVFDTQIEAWHLALFPGLMLLWIVGSFNLVGEGLRKTLDRKTAAK